MALKSLSWQQLTVNPAPDSDLNSPLYLRAAACRLVTLYSANGNNQESPGYCRLWAGKDPLAAPHGALIFVEPKQPWHAYEPKGGLIDRCYDARF